MDVNSCLQASIYKPKPCGPTIWGGLGFGRRHVPWRRKSMSMLSLLKARLGPQVRTMEGSRVPSGSPARYLLRADPNFTKSVSAIWALVKRHVPLATAKTEIERVLIGEEVVIDLPMLE